jgi:hypothetical protein
MIHAGEVHFPPLAFAAGGAVVLTLMPRGGNPIVHTFASEELQTLR